MTKPSAPQTQQTNIVADNTSLKFNLRRARNQNAQDSPQTLNLLYGDKTRLNFE
ncbi:hypothetical protein CAMRE0001_1671 [Campylobacter rectus RM3267]|uniref:Uncharacterized protein n=1 Tax=Campylobacter rectus RM3267 TaxID=553218 RepID=B9CZ89_CAMRE|nr:hypothetical protein CAMRE0001_1671 [Campylobacter rectus RM3267]